MKRFHVHVAVEELDRSIAFYAAMFNVAPSVVKPDYAKWMLDEPRLNFAISTRGGGQGINHLGFQADDESELEAMHENLLKADTAIAAEKAAQCCYAVSDKYWVTDPQGIAWEVFRSLDSIPLWNAETATGAMGPAEGDVHPACGARQATATSGPGRAGACCPGTSSVDQAALPAVEEAPSSRACCARPVPAADAAASCCAGR